VNLWTRLRENEPLQLVMWPTLGAVASILVAKGVIDADVAALIMALAVAVLGGAGIVAARSQVTPEGHMPAAVAAGAVAAVERLRGQVADTLGQPGIDVLDQVQIMVAAVETTPRRKRHGRGRSI
jgi:hypothetical protein